MTPTAPDGDPVRDAYDKVAARYASQFAGELRYKPFDRALLQAFAEQLTAGGMAGQVADIGCGPGHVTAHLAELGLTARGIDLSPAMIEIARQAYPHLAFTVGQMPGLPFGTAELVADEITAAGLAVDVIATRAPYPEVETSRTRRGYLLARQSGLKPA